MAQPDDLCTCGHALRDHCFCGCMCLHKGDAVPWTEEAKCQLRKMSLYGKTYECRRQIQKELELVFSQPSGYKLDCKCAGFKLIKESN